MPFRNTMSIVFWTETADEAKAQSDLIQTNVPEEWKPATLTSIEYMDQMQPPPVVVEEAPQAEPEMPPSV